MKILHILDRSPEPPIYGARLRIHHLMQHFTKLHEVSVICFGSAEVVDQISSALTPPPKHVYSVRLPWSAKYRRLGQVYAHVSGSSFHQLVSRSKEMQKTINRILRSDDFDVVVTEFSMMGWYDLQTRALKVLDAHNVEYDNYLRMAQQARTTLKNWHYMHEYTNLFNEESAAYRKQDALFVTSERDKDIIDKIAPGIPKYVIPNGVDTRYFVPNDNHIETNTLVFTGLMKYVPNYDGILYFLDEIFPMVLKEIPDAKIYVVGSEPPAFLQHRASANVIITGFVDDVRPYVWRSKAYVVPLRTGGGTRLKVIEAMAMKKPIITTSIGCEGIEVQHGKSVLIADDPKQFARSVIDVLQDTIDHRQLVQHGYELARSKYDWSNIGDSMEIHLQSILKSKKKS